MDEFKKFKFKQTRVRKEGMKRERERSGGDLIGMRDEQNEMKKVKPMNRSLSIFECNKHWLRTYGASST